MSLSKLFFVILFGVISSCQSNSAAYQKMRGQTMGTYYAITSEHNQKALQDSIDRILVQFNKELSTYDPESIISAFNSSTDGIPYSGREREFQSFIETITASKNINALSNGKFDPSLMPIINYWGFGYKGRKVVDRIDTIKINALMNSVGLDNVSIDTKNQKIVKSNPQTELDFSAIAKGLAVDIVCEYLDSKQIDNYLVDIGGESKTRGVNHAGNIWTVGINTPAEDAALNDIFSLIRLENKALATSGNYRNFLSYENGIKYGHTIDALSGFPAQTDILSATVISQECIEADAWATSFMAMGLEKSKQKVVQLKEIEALFIYGDDSGNMSTWHSPGFTQYLLQN